jgi:Cu-Zn family superoxide dismutase
MTRIAISMAGALFATTALAQQPAAPQPGAARQAAPQQEPATAVASFVDAEGEANGSAELSSPATGGVLVRIEVNGLPAGQWVAFHVHETGSCDHASGHESAGGHFNPGSKEHGYLAASGPHAGDMPNQYVPEDGTLRAEVFNPAVTLADGENGIRGRALMIHAGADDYRSQPSGDAGDRLACAVIE